MTLTIADISEFQNLTSIDAYAAAEPVITLRAYNGWREDYHYAANRAAVDGCAAIKACGHYSYLVATVDAGSQGVAFANTVKARGGLRPGGWIVCDLEEGAGDEAPRMTAFFAGAHSVLGNPAADDWGYSGSAFWTAHLASVTGVHRWIASYGALPGIPDNLWQDSSATTFPGISTACDASVFAGTVVEFLTLIGASAPAPAPTPTPVPTPVVVPPSEEEPMFYVRAETKGARFAAGSVFVLTGGRRVYVHTTGQEAWYTARLGHGPIPATPELIECWPPA